MARLQSLPAGAVLVMLGACYSWQLGTSSSDGGGDAFVSRQDSGQTADGAQRPHDAGAPSSDGSHLLDRGNPIDSMPAGHPEGGSCTSLFNAAMAALARAEACTAGTTPPQCTTNVKDPCGCTAFLAEPSSEPSQAYTTALAALGAASCGVEPSCTTCIPTAGECLEGPVDGGFGFACNR